MTSFFFAYNIIVRGLISLILIENLRRLRFIILVILTNYNSLQDKNNLTFITYYSMYIGHIGIRFNN